MSNKTHCINGHAYAPDNLYFDAKGHRLCRSCTLRRSADRVENKLLQRTPAPLAPLESTPRDVAFYRRIGAKGGSAPHPRGRGFQLMSPERRTEVATKGGLGGRQASEAVKKRLEQRMKRAALASAREKELQRPLIDRLRDGTFH